MMDAAAPAGITKHPRHSASDVSRVIHMFGLVRSQRWGKSRSLAVTSLPPFRITQSS